MTEEEREDREVNQVREQNKKGGVQIEGSTGQLGREG